MRRRAFGVLGGLIALMGGVFTLQGFGILGGSFMSGSGTWAVIGLAMMVAGVTLYGYSSRL